MYPRGKRVEPVNYSMYTVGPPPPLPAASRGFRRQCNFCDAAESSLYSSFSPRGYAARMDLRWLRGTRERSASGRPVTAPSSLPKANKRTPTTPTPTPTTAAVMPSAEETPTHVETGGAALVEEGREANGTRCGRLATPSDASRLRVKNTCLVVRDTAAAPPESMLVGAANATSDGGGESHTTLSQYYDERVMRLLRGTVMI